MTFLSDADLAYMRGTQAEARPSTAFLFARTSGPDGMGGTLDTYPAEGVELAGGVRVAMAKSNASSGAVPADLAGRYQESDLVKVHATVDAGLQIGDRLDVEQATGNTLTLQVVSRDLLEAWTTDLTVWAVRV